MKSSDLKAVFLFLGIAGLVALQSVAGTEDPYGPDYPDLSVPPTAAPPSEGPGSSDNYARLYRCIDKISPACGNDVFKYVFMDGDYPGRNCCRELVGMGKACHDLMVEGMASTDPELRRKLAASGRSELVWNYCVSSEGGISPSPH
ncbi:hypothetical protein MLD38_024729 [Melastoma candidum]|uniref:Uncharacterized protein n=1 Tax=Melastoma candidum TaxID=119954 RepID=A0ACB9NW88_9MYRT|nr:hypothetical protein MLD38_024729 [Melastoma candidum]